MNKQTSISEKDNTVHPGVLPDSLLSLSSNPYASLLTEPSEPILNQSIPASPTPITLIQTIFFSHLD